MDATIGTRERIKVTARRLFAERGVEAVTVREIVAVAGARNLGSLNYYFGSKEELISELLSDVFRVWSDGWSEGLSKLEEGGGPRSVRDVLEVILYGPDNHHGIDAHPTASRFLASVLFTRRRTVRELLNELDYSVFARLLGYVQMLLPDIPAPVMRQRLIFLAWYLVSVMSAYESFVASGRQSREWTDTDPRVNILDTAVALANAPVTPAGPDQHFLAASPPKAVGRRRRSPALKKS